MTQHKAEPEQGLIYEDLLPLRWRITEKEATPLDVAKLNGNNEEVLRFIDILGEHPSDTGNNEYPPLNQDLTKIEVKFELLLSLVSQLLSVYFPLPPPVQVKLDTTGVEWISSDTLNPGSYGLVEVYLSLHCPRPLIFPGKITGVEATMEGVRINAQFGELSATLRERLEKIIFRHHRRSVAQIRRRPALEPKVPPA